MTCRSPIFGGASRALLTACLGILLLAPPPAHAQSSQAVAATERLLATTLIRNSASGTIASAIFDLEEKLIAANPDCRVAIADSMQRLKTSARAYLGQPGIAAKHLAALYSDEQLAALAALLGDIGDGDRAAAVTFSAFALTLTLAGEFGGAHWPAEKAVLSEQGLAELPRFAVHFAPKFPAAEQAYSDLQQARPVVDALLARPAIRAPLQKYWAGFERHAQAPLYAANPGREAVVDAMLGRVAAQGQTALSVADDALAGHLAARYSHNELQAILAFISAPVPEGQKPHQLIRRLMLTALMQDLITSLLDEAFEAEQAWIDANGIEVVALARLVPQGTEFANE